MGEQEEVSRSAIQTDVQARGGEKRSLGVQYKQACRHKKGEGVRQSPGKG